MYPIFRNWIISFIFFVVDGGFGSWSSYGACSETCGEGTQERTRECDKPAPAHGGEECLGEWKQAKQCKVKECPGMFFFNIRSYNSICCDVSSFNIYENPLKSRIHMLLYKSI